jgi:hypothetical protein
VKEHPIRTQRFAKPPFNESGNFEIAFELLRAFPVLDMEKEKRRMDTNKANKLDAEEVRIRHCSRQFWFVPRCYDALCDNTLKTHARSARDDSGFIHAPFSTARKA